MPKKKSTTPKRKTRAKVPKVVQSQVRYYRKQLEKHSKKAKGYGYKSLDAWMNDSSPSGGSAMDKQRSKARNAKQNLSDITYSRKHNLYGTQAKRARKK